MLRPVFALILAALVGSASLAVAEEGPTPEDVTFVQGLLKRLGYDPGPVDGICGDLTAVAVRTFHEAYNLPLQPGDIEPQAASVVKNLTEVFAEYVMRPQTSKLEAYHQALAGDADAALEVGMMYHRGKSTIADKMLAYTWWSVAETHGNIEATKMKDDLAAAGEISAHEMGYTTALAEQICASTPYPDDKPSQADDKSRPKVTM